MLGGGTASLLADVLRCSHEKLIPSFFGGGVGVGWLAACFEAGGGPHGIGGRFPESPCDRGGNFGGEAAMFFSVMPAVELDCTELASLAPSKFSLSKAEAEKR